MRGLTDPLLLPLVDDLRHNFLLELLLRHRGNSLLGVSIFNALDDQVHLILGHLGLEGRLLRGRSGSRSLH